MSGWFLIITCLIEIPVLNANSVDPDQMPRSAASDLGPHCLSMSLLWDVRLNWVNQYIFSQTPQRSDSRISL